MCSQSEEQLMQIGDVATRTGLSLRTVRYYEEAGLVEPCTRTSGGFRLYGSHECAKLEMIKQLKPLGFSLDEMRELLGLLEEMGSSSDEDALRDRLRVFTERVDRHCQLLEEQAVRANEFADELRRRAGVSL